MRPAFEISSLNDFFFHLQDGLVSNSLTPLYHPPETELESLQQDYLRGFRSVAVAIQALKVCASWPHLSSQKFIRNDNRNIAIRRPD